jgi:hypothetical protein
MTARPWKIAISLVTNSYPKFYYACIALTRSTPEQFTPNIAFGGGSARFECQCLKTPSSILIRSPRRRFSQICPKVRLSMINSYPKFYYACIALTRSTPEQFTPNIAFGGGSAMETKENNAV